MARVNKHTTVLIGERNYILKEFFPEHPDLKGVRSSLASEKISHTFQNTPKSLFKQILNLTYRNLLVFWRDKSDVGITFGLSPLMTLAFFFVFQSLSDTGAKFFQHLREYSKPDVIIFLAVLSAVWFGSSKAISEISSLKIFYLNCGRKSV